MIYGCVAHSIRFPPPSLSLPCMGSISRHVQWFPAKEGGEKTMFIIFQSTVGILLLPVLAKKAMM